MTNIDATTPQMTVVKRLFDAYCTRDLKNVLPLLAKNFTFQSFPKIPDLPEQTKGGHLEKYEEIFALVAKLEVRIWGQGTSLTSVV
jgi:hypothetical protein